jgi:jumonji domain-containing protein 2
MNAIEQCPVLHPTAQEFTNFYEYMEAIDKKYSAQYGMVKVAR